MATPEHPLTVDQLVVHHMPVARSVALRYRDRGIDHDDLEQVAYLALVKAAQRFDPDAGYDFLSFAVPTIRGELRRHFRDAGWVVRPPRRLQELQVHVRDAAAALAFELGRAATPAEIADRLDTPLDEVAEALAMEGCFAPTSLDRPVGDGDASLGDLLPAQRDELGPTEVRTMLSPLVRALPERERQMLGWRFYDELTQTEIAAELGLTQGTVSRMLRDAYASLRAGLVEPT